MKLEDLTLRKTGNEKLEGAPGWREVGNPGELFLHLSSPLVFCRSNFIFSVAHAHIGKKSPNNDYPLTLEKK